MKDLIQQWFDEAAWHAPSILFFDDIDRLIPAEVEVRLKAKDPKGCMYSHTWYIRSMQIQPDPSTLLLSFYVQLSK